VALLLLAVLLCVAALRATGRSGGRKRSGASPRDADQTNSLHGSYAVSMTCADQLDQAAARSPLQTSGRKGERTGRNPTCSSVPLDPWRGSVPLTRQDR
jgi:hypothetical protein